MIFRWFKIFSLPEFLATGLVSRKITATLQGVGEKEILITRGNTLAITYEGTFLPVEFSNRNPFVRDGLAVYRDDDDFIHLGIEVES